MSCTILQCHLFQINTNVHTSWIPWIYFLKNYPYQTSYCSFKLSQFILDKIFKNLLETHMPYHVAMLKKKWTFSHDAQWRSKGFSTYWTVGSLDPCDLNRKINRGCLLPVLCGTLTDWQVCKNVPSFIKKTYKN